MTHDRQTTRPSTSTKRSTSSHWYQRRAAIGAVAALTVLAAGTTAVGLTRGESTARTQRLADGTSNRIEHDGWAGTNPRANHPTPKGTPGKAAGKAGSAAKPNGTTTTGSATSPTGGSGGASVPGTTGSTSGSTSGSSLNLSGGTAFGAALDFSGGGGFSQALSTQDSRFGKLDIVRVFYPGFPAAWKTKPELATRDSVVSFKIPPADVLSGAYDSRLLDWFRTAPRTADVFWSYWHEPENDSQINPAQYRAAWQRISNLSHQAGNSHLHSTLILMGYTAHSASHRNWRDWYPGSSAVDVLGWDVYNTGAKKGTYSSAAQLFDPIVAISRSVGKPYAVAELGSRVVPSDPSGSGRAAWLRSVVQYMSSSGALWATYWDINRGGTNSFKLTDSASIAVWRAAVSA